MGHSKMEDADGLMVVKDGCPAVGGCAALRMGRTPCGYNGAVPHSPRSGGHGLSHAPCQTGRTDVPCPARRRTGGMASPARDP